MDICFYLQEHRRQCQQSGIPLWRLLCFQCWPWMKFYILKSRFIHPTGIKNNNYKSPINSQPILRLHFNRLYIKITFYRTRVTLITESTCICKKCLLLSFQLIQYSRINSLWEFLFHTNRVTITHVRGMLRWTELLRRWTRVYKIC